jgi:hypothetical protein
MFNLKVSLLMIISRVLEPIASKTLSTYRTFKYAPLIRAFEQKHNIAADSIQLCGSDPPVLNKVEKRELLGMLLQIRQEAQRFRDKLKNAPSEYHVRSWAIADKLGWLIGKGSNTRFTQGVAISGEVPAIHNALDRALLAGQQAPKIIRLLSVQAEGKLPNPHLFSDEFVLDLALSPKFFSPDTLLINLRDFPQKPYIQAERLKDILPMRTINATPSMLPKGVELPNLAFNPTEGAQAAMSQLGIDEVQVRNLLTKAHQEHLLTGKQAAGVQISGRQFTSSQVDNDTTHRRMLPPDQMAYFNGLNELDKLAQASGNSTTPRVELFAYYSLDPDYLRPASLGKATRHNLIKTLPKDPATSSGLWYGFEHPASESAPNTSYNPAKILVATINPDQKSIEVRRMDEVMKDAYTSGLYDNDFVRWKLD